MSNTTEGRGETPWWHGTVGYEIYIRSFADADGDGTGDLRGIADRLDYLEWLGVDALWITPFFPSPGFDHGYDVSNYVDVDPVYGNLSDFGGRRSARSFSSARLWSFSACTWSIQP